MTTCKSCGYHKNQPGQASCNLCGAVLDAGTSYEPPPADPSFGRGSRFVSKGAKKQVEVQSEGPTDEQIVYVGDFALVNAFVLPDHSLVLLTPGEVFTFGRGDAADHKIDSKSVSRRHARVRWTGDPPVPEIVDLESKNGITVNGAPVAAKLLEDGDEVAMGTFTATFRMLGATGDLKAQVEVDRLSGTTAIAQRMGGEVKLISIPWLLAHLERTQESGTLTVQHEAQAGYVAFISGALIAAGFRQGPGQDETTGAEAVRRLAALEAGRFAVISGAEAHPQSIGMSIGEILGEAAPEPRATRRPKPGGPPPAAAKPRPTGGQRRRPAPREGGGERRPPGPGGERRPPRDEGGGPERRPPPRPRRRS